MDLFTLYLDESCIVLFHELAVQGVMPLWPAIAPLLCCSCLLKLACKRAAADCDSSVGTSIVQEAVRLATLRPRHPTTLTSTDWSCQPGRM